MNGFDPTGTEHVGAVGHYISALLQTAGLYGQSAVLEFMGPMIGQIGMLVYIVVCISALISFAIFGGYRNAAYLLLGPALFFFILNTKVPASGTEVRMGAQTQAGAVENQRAMLNNLSSVVWPIGEHPDVSWFFVLYDDMISQIIHNCAALLLDDSKREDLIAVGKERVYAQINMFKSTNAGFIELLGLGMTRHCAKAQTLGRELKNHTWDDAADPRKVAMEELRTKLLNQNTIEMAREATVKDYLLRIMPDSGGAVADGVREEDFEKPVSCMQVWNWTYAAAQKEAEQLEKMIVQTNRDDIGEVATTPTTANENIDRAHNNDVIPWDVVWQEVEAQAGPQASGTPDIVPLLTAILIKNTLKNTQHSAIIATMSERSDFNQARFAGKFMLMAKADAQAFYHKLMYFAGAIPYLQGLLLYLLAMVFPFFAVFLLIPGRISSFAIWMVLWLWVKSWDVGFAFVYSVRGILQHYMIGDLPESMVTAVGAPIDFSDPSAMEEFITNSDPGATEGIYMMIVALLSCSVPVLTSHLCMGASNLMGLFKLSIDQSTDRFSADSRNKSIRNPATRVNQEIKGMRLAYSVNRMDHAEKNPGKAIGLERDGSNKLVKKELDRNKTGDFTHAAHIGAQGNAANYKFMFTKQFMESHALLGSLTGRRMTFNMSRMNKAQDQVANQTNDQFFGHALGLGGSVGSDHGVRDKGIATEPQSNSSNTGQE